MSARARLWTAGGAAGAVAALAALHAAIPITVRRIEITGLAMASRAEVLRLMRVKPGDALTYAGARRASAALAAHPAFARVAVTRGVTGVLHVAVAERAPAAWISARGRAAAADGTLLPHVRSRPRGVPALEGLKTDAAAVADRARLAEGLALASRIEAEGFGAPDVLRALPGGGWEWRDGRRRIVLSGPLRPEELRRLARLREALPQAWERARRLDARFAGRVVAVE